MILTLLLLFISIIIMVQLLNLYSKTNNVTGIICGGLIIGFIIGMLYFKGNLDIHSNNDISYVNYELDLKDICNSCNKEDNKEDNKEEKKEEVNPNNPRYNDYPSDPEPFPINFEFSQNPKIDFGNGYQKDVADGWSDIVDGLEEYSDNSKKSKYDIDGCIINGNTVNSHKSLYKDEFYKNQQRKYGDDSYTAASLHFSRKPKEAFNFQSRWGVNSLRPYFAAEIDDHANRIWYEDNVDLDQYM